MKIHSQKHSDMEDGYVLLFLLLSIAVLSIGLAVAIQGIGFEIKRDREEELIHRGTQYSRAVRKFIKAVGRYPNSIEELESTNNTRFLRKRYKDPITKRDFKILRLSDLPTFRPIAGSANATSVPVPLQQGSSSPAIDTVEDTSAGGAEPGASTGLQSSQSNDPGARGPETQTAIGVNNMSYAQTSALPNSRAGAGRALGEGPMIGVASISKTTTIREFNHQDHYNEWQFVYDPSTDRGGLLTGPSQPVLQKAVQLDGQSNPASFSALGGASSNTQQQR